MKESTTANEEFRLQRDSLTPSEELQKSTESKLISAKEWLGKKYLLHPDNRVKRITKKQPVLYKVAKY
jgi:hypothetical protein